MIPGERCGCPLRRACTPGCEKCPQETLRRIPEVHHVVSRTGAPEVATDPMGMEQSDVYITLKDHGIWRVGLSKVGSVEGDRRSGGP
jgi:Cu/Ag efflux pump CusA